MADAAPATAAGSAAPRTSAGPEPATTRRPEAGLAGGPPTMGVEEEFLLVDAGTGRPVPRAADVLRGAHRTGALPGGLQLKQELLAGQAEAASGVCSDLEALARQLCEGRERLASAAAAERLRLVAAGTPVLAGPYGALSDGPRYDEISGIYAGVVADYEACGCHVHVGVPDRETAVAVVNHLRPWLSTLLALSVNSPFHDGRDTGYGSWRMVLQSRFPGSGVPPWLPSYAAYQAQLERLVECGTLADVRQSFWLVRPSPCFPTVEFRAADTAATVDEAVLQAALSRALVHTARAALDEGREAPHVDEQVAAAAVWSASRHGLRGPGVHPRLERRVPARQLVAELLRHVSPALEDAGDLHLVRRLLAGTLRGGTGADRQRAAAASAGGRGPAEAVVELLAREVVRPATQAPGGRVATAASPPRTAGARTPAPGTVSGSPPQAPAAPADTVLTDPDPWRTP